MKKIIFIIFVLNLFFKILYSFEKESFFYKPNYKTLVAKGEVLIKFKDGISENQKQDFYKKFGLVKKSVIERLKIEKLILPTSLSVQEAVTQIKNLDIIEFVEPNYIRTCFEIPNDPHFSSQWGIGKISLPLAWETIKGGNIIVAVIDTGIDYNHSDLSANIYSKGWDFVNNDNDAMDDNGHGTHVAGIIGAVTNNNIGVAGTCWNVKLLPVKILDKDGSDTVVDVLAMGILYAIDNGAKIINMSFGGNGLSKTEEKSLEIANSSGCVLVAASGNGGEDSIGDRQVCYPAAYTSVPIIAVGASDENDNKASFSNYGPELTLIAPGVNIYSTLPNNYYGYMSGTSMATPFVSGICALILSLKPELVPGQVKDIIKDSCDDIISTGIGFDEYTGYGRINAYKAISNTTSTPVNVVNAVSYPNPFNLSKGGNVYFRIPSGFIGTSSMKIKIYNFAGELVKILDDSNETSVSLAYWNGKNEDGQYVSKGLYFYIVETEKGKLKGKLTIIK